MINVEKSPLWNNQIDTGSWQKLAIDAKSSILMKKKIHSSSYWYFPIISMGQNGGFLGLGGIQRTKGEKFD